VASHVEHARRLGEVLGSGYFVHNGAFLDLGSGAGVPGLILACSWPEARAVLVDSSRRRCALLEDAVTTLGMEGRVTVRCGRAEALARADDLRGAFELVVARGFGSPAVTAECGVGFLRSGGHLAVTEPPPDHTGRNRADRWPVASLASLGLGSAGIVRSGPMGVAVMTALGEMGERWPRPVGRPTKSPLW
jgi:16S rRNA (guanine527-N7)-methyltransferase